MSSKRVNVNSRSQGSHKSSSKIIQNGMTEREFQCYQELRKQCDRMTRKATQRRQQLIQNARDRKNYEAQMFKGIKQTAGRAESTLDKFDQIGEKIISSGTIEKLNMAAEAISILPTTLIKTLKGEGANLVTELGLTISRLVVSPTLAMVAIEIISIVNKFTGCIKDALEFFVKHVKGLFDWGNSHLKTLLQDRKEGSYEAEGFGLENVVSNGEWFNLVPYGAGLAALLGSALLGMTVSKNHEASAAFSKWATYGANLSKMKSGIKTVFDFVVFVIEETKAFMVKKFPGMGISNSTVSHFRERYNFDLVEYMKEAVAITDPTRKEQVVADPTTRDRLDDLLSKTTTILLEIVEEKIRPSAAVSSQLRDIRMKLLEFAKTFDALDSSRADRFTPFVVCLSGGPGTGKSVACDILAKTLSDPRWCKVPMDRQNLIYSRNSMDKFWSLYNGQSITILDDFGQKRGATPNESEYAELINCVSATQWSVPMAAVEDKGKRFKGKLILMTTNDPYPKPAEIMCREAVWRRRNILVEVVKANESIVGMPNPIKDCTFNIMDPMNEHSGQNYLSAVVKETGQEKVLVGLTFTELCSYIVPRFNKFWDNYLAAEQNKIVPDIDLNIYEAECMVKPEEDIESSKPEEEIEEAEEVFAHFEGDDNIFIGNPENFWENWGEILGQMEMEVHGLYFGDSDPEEDYEELKGPQMDYEQVDHAEVDKNNCCNLVSPMEQNHLETLGVKYCRKLGRFLTFDGNVVPLVRNTPSDLLTYLENLCVEQYARKGYYTIYDPNPQNPFYEDWMDVRRSVDYHEAQKLYDYWYVEKSSRNYEAQGYEWLNPFGEVLMTQVKTTVPLQLSNEDQAMIDDFVRNVGLEEDQFIEVEDALLERIMEEKKVSELELEKARKKRNVLRAFKWIGSIGIAFGTAAAAYGLKSLLAPKKKEFGPDAGVMEKFVKSFPDTMKEVVINTTIDLVARAAASQASSLLVAEAAGKGSGDHRTLYPRKPIRMARAEYSYDPISEWQLMREAEGTRDKNALDFARNRLPRNLVYFVTTYNGARVAICGLGLRDRLVLVPYHFVNLFKKGVHNVVIQSIHGDCEEEIDFAKAKRIFHAGQMQDLAIIQLSMRQKMFVDITKNFVSEDELDRLHRTEGMLVRVSDYKGIRTTLEMSNFECIADVQSQETYKCGSDEYVILRGFYYRCNTAKGDCGSALVALNEHVRGKIMGVHIAGTQQGHGISVPVTAEMLQKHLEDYEAQCLKERVSIKHMLLPLEPEEVEAKASIRPGGELRVVGLVKPEFGQRLPNKTDIIPSLLYGELTSPTTEPAVLTPGDVRVDPELRASGFSPMAKGLTKFETPAKPFPVRDLDLAEQVILGQLNSNSPYGIDRRLLTLDETINGVPAANFTRINMGTSPGMPYKNYRGPGQKGKYFLFKTEVLENEEIRYVIDTERESFKDKTKIGAILLENYEMNDQRIRQGIVPDWFTYSNLKQERRKKAKIFAGETRLFECSPLDQTLLYRKYFGAFIATMNQNCTNLPSSVGINPEGPDWTLLYNRLSRFGGKVLAGDYKGWDGILPGDVMERALNVINAWYNDGPENANARRTLIEAAIHTFILCREVMILKNQGIPSGIPLTADLNGICNWFYMLCCLFELARRHGYKINAEDVERMIEFAFYGDDHVVAPHPNIQHFFNFHNVKKFFEEKGITYTDAMKTGVDPNPLEPITKVTYLKRMFVPNEDYPDKINGPIDMGTIDEEINWIRVSADDFEATFQNISAAKLQLVQHGRQVFERKMRQINEVIERKRDADLRLAQSTRWTTFSVDYDNELRNWIEQFE